MGCVGAGDGRRGEGEECHGARGRELCSGIRPRPRGVGHDVVDHRPRLGEGGPGGRHRPFRSRVEHVQAVERPEGVDERCADGGLGHRVDRPARLGGCLRRAWTDGGHPRRGRWRAVEGLAEHVHRRRARQEEHVVGTERLAHRRDEALAGDEGRVDGRQPCAAEGRQQVVGVALGARDQHPGRGRAQSTT